MPPFCTDTALLHWEPALLRSAALVSQTLLSGSGDLSGAPVIVASVSVTASHVDASQASGLDGTINGCFPLMSVDSATQLTLSVLYGQRLDDNPEASPIAGATGVPFTFRTFWPQRQ